jgi:hypothetical protein
MISGTHHPDSTSYTIKNNHDDKCDTRCCDFRTYNTKNIRTTSCVYCPGLVGCVIEKNHHDECNVQCHGFRANNTKKQG